MTTFIIVFIVLMLVGAGMAVGVIFGRKPIKGSCGGLGAVGVERACGCKDVCENEDQAPSAGGTKAHAVHYKP